MHPQSLHIVIKCIIPKYQSSVHSCEILIKGMVDYVPGSFIDIGDLDDGRQPEPRVRLREPDQGLQLARVGRDLAAPAAHTSAIITVIVSCTPREARGYIISATL